MEELKKQLMERTGISDVQATEAFNITLGRYIEEELMYQEARSKKMSSTGFLQNAITSIQKKKNCLQEWQELGKRFGGMWSTSKRPHEGESMLVRELEKRLLVDNFEQTQIKSERGLWVREQKVKIPIRLYLD